MAAPDLRRAWRRHRWLLARRAVQAAVLLAFTSGPWWGTRIAQGTLASSLWFGSVPLTDPMVALQAWLAGAPFVRAGLAGTGLVTLFYALTAGRLFCAWVCPVNLASDAAEAARRGLGLGNRALLRADRRLRHGVLVLVLLASAFTSTVVWEMVNPINWTMRAVAFGLWAGGALALGAVFLFDLLVLRHGWCGHLCPVGAFYGWLGRRGGLHVKAVKAEACTHCGDCFVICPEVQVIAPVLHPQAAQRTITDMDCLRCGRCIDHCDPGVFAFGIGTRVSPSSK